MSATVLPRLLHLLDVLAARRLVSGPVLADELGVDTRTLRRDVDRLRQLGYPVETVRGRLGGYRLARTRRLPPLVLDDRQAVAVVLGIDAVRRAGLDVEDSGTLADRLVGLLPDDVADRVTAMRSALWDPQPQQRLEGRVAAIRLLDLGTAVRDATAVHMRYADRRGHVTDRTIDPWGVVPHAGRWYVVGYDHRAEDVRLFRVDRIAAVLAGGPGTVARPDDFDLRAHVVAQVVHAAWAHAVEVELHTDLADARRRVPEGLGDLSDEDDQVVLRVGADDLDGMARVLASLGLDLTVRRPAALRTAVAVLADRLAASATRTPGEPAGQGPDQLAVPDRGGHAYAGPDGGPSAVEERGGAIDRR